MFLGHFGLGFGAKKAVPEVSLGTLFIACQFADLLWPTLVLLGIERVEIEPGATRVTPLNFVSYPYSHGLLMLCVWGIAFGVIYAAIRRSRWRAAVDIQLVGAGGTRMLIEAVQTGRIDLLCGDAYRATFAPSARTMLETVVAVTRWTLRGAHYPRQRARRRQVE